MGPRARVAAIAATAALAGALVFLPVVRHAFISDDRLLVHETPRIRDLGNVPLFFASDYWGWGSNLYRPLATTVAALEWRAFGERPPGWRAASLALHAAACAALFALGRAAGLGERAAGGAALLFAVSPVHADAVALAYAQAELIADGLLFAALALHLRDPEGRPARAAAAAGALATVACFVKETAYAFLPLALALDLALGRRPLQWRRYALYAALFAAFLAVRAAAIGTEAGAEGDPRLAGDSAISLAGRGPGARALAIVRGTAHGVGRLFVPVGLAPSYDAEAGRLVDPPAPARDAVALAIALAPLAGAALLRDRRALAGMALLYVGIAVPTNPVVILLTDRGLFLASAGAAIAAGAALERAARRAPAAWPVAAAAVLAGSFAVAARVALAAYRDPVAQWTRAAERDPTSYRAWRELAVAFRDARRPVEADPAAAVALAISPGDAELAHLRGVLALERGDPDAAAALLERAIACAGERIPLAHYHLGIAHLQAERPARAEEALRRAAVALPHHVPARFYLARALAGQGREAEARAALEEARGIDASAVEWLEALERPPAPAAPAR